MLQVLSPVLRSTTSGSMPVIAVESPKISTSQSRSCMLKIASLDWTQTLAPWRRKKSEAPSQMQAGIANNGSSTSSRQYFKALCRRATALTVACDTGGSSFATASISSFTSNCPGLKKGLSDGIEIGWVTAPTAAAASIPNLPSNRDCAARLGVQERLG